MTFYDSSLIFKKTIFSVLIPFLEGGKALETLGKLNIQFYPKTMYIIIISGQIFFECALVIEFH